MLDKILDFLTHPAVFFPSVIGGAVVTAIYVAGWAGEEQRKVDEAWFAKCVESQFTKEQCEVLLSIKRSSDEAASNAAIATFSSNMALGASQVGRR